MLNKYKTSTLFFSSIPSGPKSKKPAMGLYISEDWNTKPLRLQRFTISSILNGRGASGSSLASLDSEGEEEEGGGDRVASKRLRGNDVRTNAFL